MSNKIEGVYLLRNEMGEVIGFILRDPITGHKLVHKSEEVDLEMLAGMILNPEPEEKLNTSLHED